MKEPLLMPFQDLPFNGDTFICKEFLKLKDEFKITTAIETGSCLYSTTKWLGENFEKVHTAEINADFASFGIHKVSGMENVHTHLGDSVKFLQELVPQIKNERAIFFLDAHWLNHCPLLDELTEISKMMTPPIITIHDFYTGNEEFGYDTINGKPFNIELIAQHIHNIENSLNTEYSFYYNTKAEGAKRGIIYLKPKINELD